MCVRAHTRYPAVLDYIDVAFTAAAAARGPGSKVSHMGVTPYGMAYSLTAA